jgi:hypothetical protein
VPTIRIPYTIKVKRKSIRIDRRRQEKEERRRKKKKEEEEN